MNKFLILVGLIASTSAFAEANKFSGFSVGLNTGFDTNSTYLSSQTATLGSNSTPFNFDATYSFAIGSSSLLGLGLTYDLSNDVLYKGASGDGIIGDTTWKLKNHYSINLEPGYVVRDDALVYAKVAYHSGKSNLSTLSLNKSISGWGYGFGGKFNLDKNLYMKVEAQHVIYNSFTYSTSNITHKSTIGTIGLGYQF